MTATLRLESLEDRWNLSPLDHLGLAAPEPEPAGAHDEDDRSNMTKSLIGKPQSGGTDASGRHEGAFMGNLFSATPKAEDIYFIQDFTNSSQ